MYLNIADLRVIQSKKHQLFTQVKHTDDGVLPTKGRLYLLEATLSRRQFIVKNLNDLEQIFALATSKNLTIDAA